MNADGWKSMIKRFAAENEIKIQEAQYLYLLEDFAKLIATSDVRENIIFKGGFIISHVVGIENRKTRDLDIVSSGIDLSKEEQVRSMFIDICGNSQKNLSFFDYEFKNIKKAQSQKKGNAYEVMILARKNSLLFNLKIDLAENAFIFPSAVRFGYKSSFDDEVIEVLSYPIENILAEKFETSLDRGEFNTRIRDFVDMQMIFKSNSNLIDKKKLAHTILEVSCDRGTEMNLLNYDRLTSDIFDSPVFKENFDNYMRKNEKMNATLDSCKQAMNDIYKMIEDQGVISVLVNARNKGRSR